MLVLATLSACGGGGGGGGGAPIVKNEAAKDDRTVGDVIFKDFAIPVVTASKLSSRQDTSYAVSSHSILCVAMQRTVTIK